MSEKTIAIVGAGPGGLTAGMILARRGYNVKIYEKRDIVGGRNEEICLGPYKFDTGPTFLMMTFILREMFEAAGRKLEDYCELMPLDPMYTLSFSDMDISPSSNDDKMRAEIRRLFPGNEHGYTRFLAREGLRYKKMYPCLKKPYGSPLSLLSQTFMKALPHLALTKTLYQNLAGYFTKDKLRIAFTFQAKYLGMSPWECPAAFTIIPFIEHSFGIDHVTGGLSKISEAMATVAKEHCAEINLSTTVKKVLVKNGAAYGIELEDGTIVEADAVVINADFGHAMTTLFDKGTIKKYTEDKLNKKSFSCSTFMLYLGLDTVYAEPHHKIIFANDYKNNIEDISRRFALSDDMSVYIRNASVTDPTLAPAGHSAVYVLVPVPNNNSNIEWNESQVQDFKNKVLDRIESRTSMKDIREHIVQEKIITPKDWSESHDVFLGATFNLGHTLTQMLYLRPHNRFEEVEKCYLVGGGTHPGSGLPTIYESGRISADLISKDLAR